LNLKKNDSAGKGDGGGVGEVILFWRGEEYHAKLKPIIYSN
jgi:hypothetical protein